MANQPSYNNYHDIGNTGEDLVATWLESQGWTILHRQWRTRWGEIDIIAQKSPESTVNSQKFSPTLPPSPSPLLAFVEVKTRSQGNWDDGGRNAIAWKKQSKIGRAAQMFLAKNPEKADYNCRFDVAIVNCQPISNKSNRTTGDEKTISYQLVLEEYIPSAFEHLTDD